jgi:predicted polyphosphate/ATP-dependent NAD kinase
MTRVGFLINPIAGMGGRVGLKGTDGVATEAARLGATPLPNARALEALRALKQRLDQERVPAYPECKLVLSPIGAQGFVLGRGNQQLSPTAIRRIGAGNIILVATPAELARTPVLRFDTGDPTLDQELSARNFIPVIVGYRHSRLVKVAG